MKETSNNGKKRLGKFEGFELGIDIILCFKGSEVFAVITLTVEEWIKEKSKCS